MKFLLRNPATGQYWLPYGNMQRMLVTRNRDIALRCPWTEKKYKKDFSAQHMVEYRRLNAQILGG